MLGSNLLSFFPFSEGITQDFSSGCLHDLRNEEVKMSEEDERKERGEVENGMG